MTGQCVVLEGIMGRKREEMWKMRRIEMRINARVEKVFSADS